MDLMKNHSEHDPAKKVASPTDRRSFLRTLIGGIGIAVPAISVLSASRASASTAVPTINPCTKTYLTLLGISCGGVAGSCPVGSGFECVAEWERRSAITGQSCGIFFTNEGPCTLSCPASSASAAC
jgi:hypothetical protein